MNRRLGTPATWGFFAAALLVIVACTGTPSPNQAARDKTGPDSPAREGTPFADQGLGLASGGAESSADTAAALPNFDDCSGFLPLEVVRDFTKIGDLELETRKAPVVGSADVTGLKAVCLLSYQTPDQAKSITVQASQFVSPSVASSRLQAIQEFASQQATIKGAPVDANSFQAILNAGGIGSYVVFQTGAHQVQVTTVQTVGDPPLLTAEQLPSLAEKALIRFEGG